MGLIWDLIQQNQISTQAARAGTLEQRVMMLETQLQSTQRLLHAVIQRLEVKLGSDLDSDGRVG